MTQRTILVAIFCLLATRSGNAQSTPVSPATSAIWNSIVAGTPDPAQTTHTENVEIVRDKAHITLVDGTLQLIQPANGRVYAAAFRGDGRIQVDIPNTIEGQQLRLLAKLD